MKTLCCNYETKEGQENPVYWNPGNQVVQCHNCGQVYVPSLPLESLSASVKIMRSHDYCHFEVSLAANDITRMIQVDALRKEAARLVDRAVEQYKVMMLAMETKTELKNRKWLLEQARCTPEAERNPKQKAVIKFHQDEAFAKRFGYDYEDEWEAPELDDEN